MTDHHDGPLVGRGLLGQALVAVPLDSPTQLPGETLVLAPSLEAVMDAQYASVLKSLEEMMEAGRIPSSRSQGSWRRSRRRAC